jgi:ABC-type bacteriocin/lantibiotic exporter with double-glycine peptidase domain
MKLEDINATVFAQLDPTVAQAVIEAQTHSEMWNTLNIVGSTLCLVALFWVIFKYA